MKKILFLLLCTATVSVAIFVVGGCSPSINSADPPEATQPSDTQTPEEKSEIRFVADGETVAVFEYSSGDTFISVPEVPPKKGYSAEWENYSLSGGNITVNAIYTPIDFTVTYICDGTVLQVLTCTVENFYALQPAVPERYGYEGSWIYGKNEDGDGYTATADYALKIFTVNFYVDGQFYYSAEGSVEYYDIAPAVPAKPHFNAEWEEIIYESNPVEVNAVYTPVEYSVLFTASGTAVAELTYTVIDNTVSEPAVPEKQYYSGEWEKYSLTGGDVTVNAVYTPITYTAYFYADGREVAAVTYTVESKDVEIPQVPVKSGYEGAWQAFELTGGNVRIEAIYTALEGTSDLEYERLGDGWTVAQYNGSQKEIVIPSVHEGLPVIAVSAKAFENCAVEKVNICEGVQTIGERAFRLCEYLTEIVLPDSLREIGSSAFTDCVRLEYLALPDGVKVISTEAFVRCGFTQVKLPKNLEVIGDSAFYLCLNLLSVTVPATVKTIDSKAFAGCENLESVVYEGEIPAIGENAFLGCGKLRYIA